MPKKIHIQHGIGLSAAEFIQCHNLNHEGHFGVSIYDIGGDSSVEVESIEHAQSLIEGLQKAIDSQELFSQEQIYSIRQEVAVASKKDIIKKYKRKNKKDSTIKTSQTQVAQSNSSVDVTSNNWKLIVEYSDPLLNRKFRATDGKKYYFLGPLWADDDFYYTLYSKKHGLKLLSCVGNIEGYGYKLISEN